MSKYTATPYNVRRYMTLVQVLALEGDTEELRGRIRFLCKSWDVWPAPDTEHRQPNGKPTMDALETVRRLAQHVMDYHRDELKAASS